MIPPAFDYLTPQSLSEVIGLLHQHGPDAKVLAGGHNLIPAMRLRFAEPRHLIEISGLEDLNCIREADGLLRIGAMTREADLEDSEIVQTGYPILLDTAKMIADPQVRNLAPVGATSRTVILPMTIPPPCPPCGQVEITGQGGKRIVPIDEFFPDFFTTVLDHGEILTEIQIPAPPPNSGGAYLKIECKVGDDAGAAGAAQVSWDEDAEPTLQAVLQTHVSYVAFIGSKKQARALKEYLQQEGIPGKRLDALYAPAGLDLHAKSPGEIAVSVLAEIVQLQAQLS